MKHYFEKFSLKSRILLFVSCITIFITVVLTYIFLIFASNAIREEVEAQVVSILKTKKEQSLRYFDEKYRDLTILSDSNDIKNSFFSFQKSFQEFRQSPQKLKNLYIDKNPFPKGRKEELKKADDNSNYSKDHERYHPYFQKYVHTKFFYDLFLIDLEGNILYSVSKEDDYATNLITGVYKDSNLAKVFIDARANGKPGSVSFSDFQNYAPSNHDPAAFIATPIYQDKIMVGILALQMSMEEINSLMKENYMTDSSAIYMVGSDRLFRTIDHRYPQEKFILRQRSDTNSVQRALDGGTGVIVETNYRGTEVYTAFSPLVISGVKYAILSEFHTEVALIPLKQLRNKILGIFLILLFVVSAITVPLIHWIARPITGVIGMLSSSAREIATTIEQQEKTAQMQSASVNQTSTTMEELGATSRHNAEQTGKVSEKSIEAQGKAKQGAELVLQMVRSMEDLKVNVDSISKQILDLSEKNNQISDIINLVSDIAVQTNMLALNAAVEAARAGEYGKGFAVVAVEIRKLADESNVSAEKIQEILLQIKKSTDNSVMAAEEGNKKVERSVQLGLQVSDSFRGIQNAIDTVFQSVEQISLNIRQQSIAVNEIVQAMDSLNKGSEETAIGIGQIKKGISQVNEAAIEMKGLVDGRNN